MYGATAECRLLSKDSLLNQAIEDLDLSQTIGHMIDMDFVDTMKECFDESKQPPAVSVYQQQTTASTELSSSCSSGSSVSTASSQDCDYQPYPVAYGYDAYPVTGRLSNILHDYTIFSKVLGSGGSGTVRECLNRRTNECFAVKTVEKAKIGCVDHLRREIEVLSSIQHPSIIRIVDCYEDLNYVHIVTEKCSGGELFDKIDRCFQSQCFDEQSAARTIKSLLEAVAYLHANGLVHRDIKPENILLESQDDDDSPIKLIDFGSARRHRHDVDCNMSSIHGTIYYMVSTLHHAFISPIGLSPFISCSHSCTFNFYRLPSCSSIITPLLLTFGLSEL
jgi:hypothetical protein